LLKRHFNEASGHNQPQRKSTIRLSEEKISVITQTTSLSSPAPIPVNGMPEPSGKIQTSQIEFGGAGSEYFRIWIVNLLLIMVTFGIYYPWAKVRKLKYFYNNTHIDGHALEFHGEAKKMLRGSLIVGVFFMIYSVAVDFSAVAGLIAILSFMALGPVLFRGAMRFRLANTSWRGMRMRFVAQDLKEAYWSIVPALALFLLPGVILAFLSDEPQNKSAVMPFSGTSLGLYVLAAAIAIPYFFWRLKRYQHNHYAWGPLQTQYRSEVGATYKVFGLTVLMVLLISALFAAAIFLLTPNTVGSMRSWSQNLGLMASVLIPLFFVFIIAINIAPRAYFTAKMQNLIWSRTGNNHFRFKSDLAVAKFMGLQFKNYLLIAITLGLYWPFAVVATKRMQLEAISLKTRVSLDALTNAARARENDAAGDMAADIFGFDVGM
jgi:uncharacterized membrane protein YjgN (DUF898 family)